MKLMLGQLLVTEHIPQLLLRIGYAFFLFLSLSRAVLFIMVGIYCSFSLFERVSQLFSSPADHDLPIVVNDKERLLTAGV